MSHGSPRHLKCNRNRRKEKRPQLPDPEPTVEPIAAKVSTRGLLFALAQPLHMIAWSQAVEDLRKTS
jgi:hypothetical protein